MKEKAAYRREKLSFLRKAVRASATVSGRKNAIHSFTEIDISRPRALLAQCEARFGTKPSFTAYIVSCFANSITRFPQFNAFISGNSLITLDETTISVLMERNLGGVTVPEPIGIRHCECKTYAEISDEIRAAQARTDAKLGQVSGSPWFHLVPAFLLKLVITAADKNVRMGAKYGKLAVTAMGMFSREAVWFIPNGSATILVTVGSIITRVVEVEGKFESREHLCLTVSFDHDIVDGAPAARFMNDLIGEIRAGEQIAALLES